MRSLEELDRWIAGKVKRLSSNVAGAPQKKELLEIRRDILEDVRNQIEPKGSGKYVFAYNSVAVQLAARDETEQALLHAAFAQDSALEEDIRALLAEAGCPVQLAVSVDITCDPASAGPAQPCRITYSSGRPRGEKKAVAARPPAKLTVVRGSADPPEFVIRASRVNIGRLQEVLGEKEGLRRRNDVAFADTEATVSREHAYIRYDAEADRYRICDHQSTRGTSVFRDGRRIEVPRASARGVQLESGDEIHLGDARIRFETEAP